MAAIAFVTRALSVIIVLMIAAPASAQAVTLPFAVQAKLSGVDVTFPVQATLTPAPAGGRVGVVAKVDLEDFKTKFDGLIRSAGLDRPPGGYQSFDYKGTILEPKDGRLWAKYHFKVDFRHLPATNGSVELFFRLIVEADALRIAAESPKLNVSNDLVRGVVRGMKLDDRLASDGIKAVNGFLSGPEARLRLPKELVAMNGTLKSARFAAENGRLLLVAEGDLSPIAEPPSAAQP